ncbi:AAA family ATPase [Arthrobacter sp. NPDC092385]|uniref:AAA family ATPase n=1 Tax=Arthrobacter sp. NPDC092385 TaxID=3363943 RepID=UPI0037F60FD0
MLLPEPTTIPAPAIAEKPDDLEERVQGDGDLTDADRAFLLQLQRHQAVQQEVERERARREARQILDAEENLKQFRVPPSRPTLTAELLIADPPLDYAVDQLLPMGGNVLLTAQFKTGRSTTINNLAKSFADQIDFLGKYSVHPDSGRTAIFNYEVDDRLYRKWLRELNVDNTDMVSLLNLRGFRMPVTVKYVEDWTVGWLADHESTNWIVDPFARAFTGVSENDNTEVGRFLDTLDVIKNRGRRSEPHPSHPQRVDS